MALASLPSPPFCRALVTDANGNDMIFFVGDGCCMIAVNAAGSGAGYAEVGEGEGGRVGRADQADVSPGKCPVIPDVRM